MTLEQWRANADLATDLAKILASPVLQSAISLLREDTMARHVSRNGLITKAINHELLFGWDVGRSSILDDLQRLSETPEEIEIIQPTYNTP
jgi:hypothetical protein